MRLFRRKSKEIPSEAIEARKVASEASVVAQQQRRNANVELRKAVNLMEALEQIREKNHFAESLRISFGKDRL